MEFNKRKLLIGITLLVIVYFVGITGFLLETWRESIVSATPINILFCTILLFTFQSKWDVKILSWLALVAIGGWLIEVWGVHSGFVFGDYEYGVNLGPGLFGVPFMMAINWLMLTYMAAVISSWLKWSKLLKSLVGAAIMVGYDMLLEPIAIEFDMWQWSNNIIPYQNYLAWFIFGFAFQLLFHTLIGKQLNKIVLLALLLQIIFFLVVLFSLKYN